MLTFQVVVLLSGVSIVVGSICQMHVQYFADNYSACSVRLYAHRVSRSNVALVAVSLANYILVLASPCIGNSGM